MTNTSDPNMERQLHHALETLGWLIPTTPDRIELAEHEAHAECLPGLLRDPDHLLQRLQSDRLHARLLGNLSNGGASKNLARAAREGKIIPGDVEERMRADRERAEEKRNRRSS